MHHDHVLKLWNDFCIDSGLREYCQNICKGRCCAGANECGRKCAESVSCSVFLCDDIRYLFPREIRNIYERYLFETEKIAQKAYRIKNNTKIKCRTWGYNYSKLNFEEWIDPTNLINMVIPYIYDAILHMISKRSRFIEKNHFVRRSDVEKNIIIYYNKSRMDYYNMNLFQKNNVLSHKYITQFYKNDVMINYKYKRI